MSGLWDDSCISGSVEWKLFRCMEIQCIKHHGAADHVHIFAVSFNTGAVREERRLLYMGIYLFSNSFYHSFALWICPKFFLKGGKGNVLYKLW